MQEGAIRTQFQRRLESQAQGFLQQVRKSWREERDRERERKGRIDRVSRTPHTRGLGVGLVAQVISEEAAARGGAEGPSQGQAAHGGAGGAGGGGGGGEDAQAQRQREKEARRQKLLARLQGQGQKK